MKIRALILFCLFFLSSRYLSSQEIPYLSAFLGVPWGNQNWETSRSFPTNDPNLIQTISVPFVFPMETALLYSYMEDSTSLNTPAVGRSDYRFPFYWGRNTSIQGQRGMTFLYRKKNFGLNLDFSLQLAGNEIGSQIVEATVSKARLSYRVPNPMLGIRSSQVRLDVFLELSELQAQSPAVSGYWNKPMQQVILKSPENSNRPSFTTKQIYLNPGVSLNTSSNFIFEGLVRVPMNAREANRTLDELWAPEIQTNLGLKYVFPTP